MTNATSAGNSELNLVPYLDIMTNLVVFMLVSTAFLVPMQEVPVLVPSLAPGGGAARSLTVAVSPGGLAVVPSDGAVVELLRDPSTGALPFDRLTETLRAFKSAGVQGESVRLVADYETPYSEVVATMDAARKDGAGSLYPGVQLATASAR